MTPMQPRKAHLLTDLTVEEVSVVDRGSNRGARVAFFKRDADAPTTNTVRKEKPMKKKFKKILKSALTRDQIAAAVEAKAIKVGKRLGMSEDESRAAIWQNHNEAYAAYENAPLPTVTRKAALPLVQITQAEIELDTRARKIMKSDGLQYPQACSKILTQNPGLYKSYCDELARGETLTAPDPTRLDVPLEVFQKVAKAADADGVCAECDAPVDSDDSYCAACGADLAAQHATKAKPKAAKKPGDSAYVDDEEDYGKGKAKKRP